MQETPPHRGRLPAEREVLRVLWANPGRYFVRSEVFRRMPEDERPTLGRVGQILVELKKDQLLQHVQQRAQGNRQAAFYTLSDRGVELCRHLGFERQELSLFPVTTSVLQRTLTRERLTQRPAAPGRITAAYAYRGGLGCSTMVAHVAHGIASSFESSEQVLVVDLGLGAPGLDSFLNPRRSGSHRGLGGLLVDYRRKTRRKRSLWLRTALSSPDYVRRPFDDVPNLVFLPSGLSPGQDLLSSTERAEALSALRAEVGLMKPENDEGGTLAFLNEFRVAVLDTFAKTVVDSQAGHCLSSWIATQALADQLVMCVRKTDTSPATISGLRAVLARFIQRQHPRQGESGGAAVLFLFSLLEPKDADDFDGWIDKHLVFDSDGPATPPSYSVERLAYDTRFARPTEQSGNLVATRLYDALIERLLGRTRDGRAHLPSPTLQVLIDMLDPKKPKHRRSLAAGGLMNLPLQELGRLLDWYGHHPALHVETDAMGKELVADVVSAQSRRLRSMLLRLKESV